MTTLSAWPTEAGDGVVATEDRWRKMARLWAASGVAGGVGSELSSALAGGTITTQPGAAWVDGHYTELAAAASTPTGGDGLLVIRYQANAANLLFLLGVSAPTQTDLVWELPLASVTGGVLSDLRRMVWPGGGRAVGCRLRRLANIASVADSTDTPIPFDSEDLDTDGFWTPGTPTEIVLPRRGLYVVTARINWGSGAGGYRTIKLQLFSGGSWSVITGEETRQAWSTNVAGYTLAPTHVVCQAPGERYRIVGNHTNGSAISVVFASAGVSFQGGI